MPVDRVAEELRGRVAELIAPLAAPGALPGRFRLDEWESEQGLTLLFSDGTRALQVELDAPDPARDCFARTRRFNVSYNGVARGGAPLDPDERALLERVVALIGEHERKLPVAAAAAPTERAQVREVEVARGLVREAPGVYYLNPYVGCLIGCPFCYAQHRADFSRALEGLAPARWGRWVDVKVNLPEVLARELASLPPGPVRMSPIVTDPYQPVERRYRVTRGCLEAMATTRFTPVVLTRSSLVLDDAALLARCHRAAVGVSVPTDDDAVREAFEPGTEPIAERVALLAALKRAGLRTFAVIQPMLPLDPERLAALLAPSIDAARIGPMFEKPRSLAVYARLGREDALEEPWERRTFAALASSLSARHVRVNPNDGDWSSLR